MDDVTPVARNVARRAEDVVERGRVVGGKLVGDDERLGEIVVAAAADG